MPDSRKMGSSAVWQLVREWKSVDKTLKTADVVGEGSVLKVDEVDRETPSWQIGLLGGAC